MHPVNKSEWIKLKGYLEAVSQRSMGLDVIDLKPSYQLGWEKTKDFF